MRLTIALALVLSLSPAAAQDKGQPPRSKVDQAAIDAAIEKGGKYLIDEAKKGLAVVKHTNGGGDIPEDEIVFYTLLHAGIDHADETFQKLLDRLLTKDLEKTYAVCLMAMGLESFDSRKYQYRIAQCAQFLADNQCKNGQWDYGKAVPLEKKAPPKKDVGTGGGKQGGDADKSVNENPKYQDPRMWHTYWLYAIERVGMLFGTEFLGKHEWYPEGVKVLLETQTANGAWQSGSLGGPVADTCFAILFLRRATKPLPKVATGR